MAALGDEYKAPGCHFFHVLLAKAGHRAKPKVKGQKKHIETL